MKALITPQLDGSYKYKFQPDGWKEYFTFAVTWEMTKSPHFKVPPGYVHIWRLYERMTGVKRYWIWPMYPIIKGYDQLVAGYMNIGLYCHNKLRLFTIPAGEDMPYWWVPLIWRKK